MKTKFKQFINEKFLYFNDELIMAGKSKYPVGTKIKIKNLKGDDSELSGLTGTLTHPFGGYGDVGVYLDEKGIYYQDIVSLKNNEYIVIDDEAIELLKKYKLDKAVKKYNL